ncbi:MAG: T9SS type A sorting domain-containing protein [Bacteroidota bacterium]
MIKQLVFISIISIFLPLHLWSQTPADTILVYDVSSQITSTILPVAITSTLTSDFTTSSPGSMGNVFPLSLTPPTTNLFNGSNFSRLARATDFFSLANYPMRTVVRLREHYDDTSHFTTTGMIVAPCLVLTSASGVYEFFTRKFLNFDSLRVSPAFNNGLPQAGLPSALVKKIYLFKKFYDQRGWEDIALLELKHPIGLQTGWTGIGFNADTNFTAGKVYHKFSYPSVPDPSNTLKVYNGDTLYYNYGYINENPPWLMVNSPEAFAIPGQGGSTFMYTDNSNYYSVGLCSYSNNYIHYKITRDAFYQLKNVMTNLICEYDVTAVDINKGQQISLRLYPNPLDENTKLEFSYEPGKQYELLVTDALGRSIKNIPVSSGEVSIKNEALPPGIYFLNLKTNKGESSTVKLLVD